ncbi:MAG: hypothetical protein V4683_20390 [Bacteroidota bacterium]
MSEGIINKEGKRLTIQEIIFQKIKEKLTPDQDMPQELAKVLDIGIHSAYRRLRNEVSLGLDELEKLIEHYQLNFFEFISESPSSYYFHGTNLDKSNKDYRSGLLKYVYYVENFKLIGVKCITYCGLDIMPLKLMSSPIILTFQEYFWNYTLGQQTEETNIKLSFDNIDDEIVKLSAFFLDFLQASPSVEVWSSLSFDSVVNHLEYLRETNRFASENDVQILYKELEKILNWTELQATAGVKTDFAGTRLEPETSFSLYKSDLFFSDSNFFVQTFQQDFVALKHNFFSYMFTYHSDFVQLNKDVMQTIITKSQPLSATNEKARIAFFSQLRERIDRRRQK